MLRRLARAPVFVATTVGVLAVGIGAFAVVYTAVDRILLAPLPYERPDDLYYVWRNYTWIPLERGWLGGPDVAALDAAGGVIQEAVALRRQRATLGGRSGEMPMEIAVISSSPDLFRLLGVTPALGRGFSPEHGGPGRLPVIVLGHDLWRQQFGADSAIVGSDVRLNGEPFTVIGVMGREFRFQMHGAIEAPQRADAYVTFGYDVAQTSPMNGVFAGLIRVRPGTTPLAAAEVVRAVGAVINERDFKSLGLELYATGVKSDLVSRIRPALFVLGLAGIFLALMLLLNLATLLLSRAAQREREFAIARAVGADRSLLLGPPLLEGALLGLLGGVGGALLAIWGTRLLVSLAPFDLPRRESVAVDWRIAAIVIGVGALLGLLAAAVPAVKASRARLATLVGSIAVRGGGGHSRMQHGLVIVQIALTLVLLTTGGLVVRSFSRLLQAEPGFDAADVLTFRVPVLRSRYDGTAAVNSLHERIQRELARLPGVGHVGATSKLPLTSGSTQSTMVQFPGAPGNTGEMGHDRPLIDLIRVRPGLFEALRIPVLSGRVFTATTPGAPEAVIDRTLAAIFFPSGDPIGATLEIADHSLTVVGVIEHARQYNVHEDGRSQVYIRNDYAPSRTLSFVLRTDRPMLSLVPEVRTVIRQIDRELAISDIRPMEQIVADSLRRERLIAVLVAGFAVGALSLAALGIFGVVSGSVARRGQEFAVRLALGANRNGLLVLVLRDGALLIVVGLVLGAPGIYLAGRVVAGVLVGLSPFDPVTISAVVFGLAIVALLACFVPARRAMQLEPVSLLNAE